MNETGVFELYDSYEVSKQLVNAILITHTNKGDCKDHRLLKQENAKPNIITTRSSLQITQ